MSSALAIAGVSAVLQFYLNEIYSNLSFFPGTPTVSSVAPDLVQEGFGSQDGPQNQVNLFLHQVTYNQGWRNMNLPSLGPDGRTQLDNPALALDLHYLLTVYGSEDWQAEALLGYGVQMLHQNAVLTRNDISNAISKLPAKDPSNPLSTPLGGSGLANQIEMIKITPATLGREELAWLWTALKADYRPTFPFQVSVVLIQTQPAGTSGPPVLSRTVAAQPSFLLPFPHVMEAGPPNGKLAASLGDTVTVTGTGLAGAINVVLSTAQQQVQQTITPLSSITDVSFQFIVPNPSLPPPQPNPTDLPAGVYVLSATIKTAQDTIASNSVPLVIAPAIDPASVPATLAAGPSVPVTVTCRPYVRPSQQVSLLIGGQQAAADNFTTPTNTPSFTFKALLPTAGKVPVWMRVDGVDSQIVDTTGPQPKYSGPFTKVN
jgi:hypothetical protein